MFCLVSPRAACASLSSLPAPSRLARDSLHLAWCCCRVTWQQPVVRVTKSSPHFCFSLCLFSNTTGEIRPNVCWAVKNSPQHLHHRRRRLFAVKRGGSCTLHFLIHHVAKKKQHPSGSPEHTDNARWKPCKHTGFNDRLKSGGTCPNLHTHTTNFGPTEPSLASLSLLTNLVRAPVKNLVQQTSSRKWSDHLFTPWRSAASGSRWQNCPLRTGTTGSGYRGTHNVNKRDNWRWGRSQETVR